MKESIQEDILRRFSELINWEDRGKIGLDTILEDTGIESLSLISFIVQLEERYNVEFADDFLEEIMLSNLSAIADTVSFLVEGTRDYE